jgi:hypothetical protein
MISLKYPDANISSYHYLLSVIFILILFLVLKKEYGLNKKLVRVVLLIDACACFIAGGLELFQPYFIKNIVFSIIEGIKYPLYLLWVTPLFGLNFFFHQLAGSFSILAGIFYLVVLGVISLPPMNSLK